ncbi:thiolase family protein [Mycobacterium sp. EPa45]|uniref:thiolase family protein n=1 Tax=Mycobacterium sp. EPa45 TaxID=1545728 RepID=UPI0006427429|nr:thiolase family protein [Mycobacterium sp. EPa45]AKK26663.1 peptide permease [Mycobacterium sp. EPa45]
MSIANRVAVVGYAQSPTRRRAERPLGAIAVDTARAAIADAGLTVDVVDGFVSSSMLPSAGGHQIVDGVSTVTSGWLARSLGAEPRYVAGFDGIGQLSGSIGMAVNAIIAGAADYVVVHRALHNPAGSYHTNPNREFGGAQQWTAPQGFFGPLAMIALPYNEYLHRFGARRESMAAVVTEARRNGARLPTSFWAGRSLTVDEYLAEPTLVDPVCRLDCDIPVDGVAAFVLTSAERARDLPNRPVYVAGFAGSGPPPRRLPLHWPLDDIFAGGLGTVERLWQQTGLGITDVDLPQVYDGFSPLVWFWLEALGLCPVGEAHRFVASGGIDADHGGVPALLSGGALGNGRLHGVPQMVECYLQLARRAGERQRDASIGLACQSSPHYGGVVAYSSSPI